MSIGEQLAKDRQEYAATRSELAATRSELATLRTEAHTLRQELAAFQVDVATWKTFTQRRLLTLVFLLGAVASRACSTFLGI